MKTKTQKAQILWDKLLKQNPTNKDLLYIIECVEPLRDQALQQLFKQNPTQEELLFIDEYVKRLWE